MTMALFLIWKYKMPIKPYISSAAKILYIQDFPSSREETAQACGAGQNGWELENLCKDAKLPKDALHMTCLCEFRPPNGDIYHFMARAKKDITLAHTLLNGRHVLPPVVDGYFALNALIDLIQPNVLLVGGKLSLHCLFGETSTSKWRGSCLEYKTPNGTPCKLIPTFSMEDLRGQYHMRPIFIRDLQRAYAESNSPTYAPRPEYNFIVRPTLGQVESTLNMLIGMADAQPELPLAVDVETRAGHLACIGLGWSLYDAICIPLMCVEDAKGYWTELEETQILYLLWQLLSRPNVKVLGQNFIYDIQYLHRFCLIAPPNVFDTMLASHTLFSTMEKGLDMLSSLYCERHVYWKDEGKKWDPVHHSEDVLWEYNCKDCVVTFEIASRLETLLKAHQQWEQFLFQMQTFHLAFDAMEAGVAVDLERRKAVETHYLDLQKTCLESLHYAVGYPLNPKSPKQMSQFFYEELRLPVVRNPKSKAPTCDDNALATLSAKEPLVKGVCGLILDIRSCGTLLSNAIQRDLDCDGRLRCSYNVGGTSTYRLASSQSAFGIGMNLQNITSEIKSYMVPDPGYMAWDMDLDAADLRIVVAEAGETRMQEWFDMGQKPYVMIAREFYQDDSITKEHAEYRLFKGICHGTNYLGKAKGIAANVGKKEEEIERIQSWYLKRFAAIARWQQNFKAKLMSRKMVSNIFGNRLVVFQRIEGNVYNEAIAWLPQSTIALLINRIWVNLVRDYPHIQVRMQTHDSLSGQFPIDRKEECLAQLREAAKIVLPYPSPITIPVGIKTSAISYGDCS